MNQDPLLTTLLDIDAALNSRIEFILGGGYGLYLKQLYLKKRPEIRTLLPLAELPAARTTRDIDLILRAEVVTDSNRMKPIRDALDQLDFRVVDTAKYTQFIRRMQTGEVKIDLLAAPLGALAARVPKDPRRVRPRPSVKLHASKLEEALGVDRSPLRIPIEGTLSSGESHQTGVLIPQAFTYLLMKLCAFRDRMHDDNKELGRHHALDVCRIIGLLTRDEDEDVRELSTEFATHPIVEDARRIAQTHFISEDGMGRIRIQEHQLYTASLHLDRIASELGQLFFVDT